MKKSVSEMTDDELVAFGTPSTNEALQAEKEMTRRLKDSMDKWSKRQLIANWVLVAATVAIVGLTVVLVWEGLRAH
jgi:hypothetical protein